MSPDIQSVPGPLLMLRDIEVQFRRSGRAPVRAVAGASLSVERGQILGLVGETGCGKSTLARVAVGLIAPTAGSVQFDGGVLKPLGRGTRSRRDARIQMVFQNPFNSLNPRRKIGHQLGDGPAILDGASPAARRARVAELLDQVGVPVSAAERYPHEYSGGQRQRIAIARALAASPSVVVLDEPLSSLDASAQAQVANLLIKICRSLGVAMVLISHDLAIVRHVCDVVAVMYLGTIVEEAPTSELWTNPLHPYTQALIGAIPRADGNGVLPESLAGEVPDPANPPSGCRFHPRCPFAFDRCRTQVPPLLDISRGRRVACWLHDVGSEILPPSSEPRSSAE